MQKPLYDKLYRVNSINSRIAASASGSADELLYSAKSHTTIAAIRQTRSVSIEETLNKLFFLFRLANEIGDEV